MLLEPTNLNRRLGYCEWAEGANLLGQTRSKAQEGQQQPAQTPRRQSKLQPTGLEVPLELCPPTPDQEPRKRGCGGAANGRSPLGGSKGESKLCAPPIYPAVCVAAFLCPLLPGMFSADPTLYPPAGKTPITTSHKLQDFSCVCVFRTQYPVVSHAPLVINRVHMVKRFMASSDDIA